MSQSNKQSSLGVKLSLASLVVAGSAILGSLFLRKKYSNYLIFKDSCRSIMTRLHEENQNPKSTVKPCLILNESQIYSIDGSLRFALRLFQMHEDYYTSEDPSKGDCFMAPFTEGIYISTLSPTHTLVFNKYPVFKNHLLVITWKFEYQEAKLTGQDLFQSYVTLIAIRGFCFYNYNKIAGASQTHKHLQVVPFEHFNTPVLKQLLSDFEKEELDGKEFKRMDLQMYEGFKYAAYKFKEISHNESQETYEQFLLQIYQNVLNDLNDPDAKVPYNMVMFKDGIFIVQRQKECFKDKISINGFILVGSLGSPNKEKYDLLLSSDPQDILNEVLIKN